MPYNDALTEMFFYNQPFDKDRFPNVPADLFLSQFEDGGNNNDLQHQANFENK